MSKAPEPHHQDHEGATESAGPGEPVTRDIVKPGWADLEENLEKAEGGPDDSSTPDGKPPDRPVIDRRR
jgi:hypothetical protein